MMEIQTYTAQTLYDFTQSQQFMTSPDIPISTIRAISYKHNPRGEETDIVMIMCFEEGELRGYLGILPDFLYINKENQQKCGWMSCIWVHPTMRGRGVAKMLLTRAFDAWKGNLLLTEFTDEAGILYHKSGLFQDFAQKKGLRCYLKWDLQTILPKKNARFQSIQFLLKASDFFTNQLYKVWLPKLDLQKESFHYEEIKEIDVDLRMFVEKAQLKGDFQREAEEWKWMRDFPWIKNDELAQAEAKRYAFSVHAQAFNTLWIKLVQKGHIVGFMICTLRNQQMKIPYLYVKEENIEAIAKSILSIAKDNDIATLISYHPSLCRYFAQNTRYFIYTKAAKRDYLISKQLAEKIENRQREIQDGDGDCAFT